MILIIFTISEFLAKIVFAKNCLTLLTIVAN
jgi:hypothetical protein